MRFKYLQHHAHLMTKLAISHGDLVVPERCGCCLRRDALEAHHTDYSKPLEVIWLCRKCHAAEHNTDEENKIRHPFGKRKKIADIAWQVLLNGDADMTTNELMTKYGVSVGSTTKIRKINKTGGS